MPEPEKESGAAGVQGPAVGHGGGVREVEQEPVAFGCGLVLGGVVDLLEDVRYREHGRRLELDQAHGDVLDIAGVRHVDPVVHRCELDRPRQDVRERGGTAASGCLR